MMTQADFVQMLRVAVALTAFALLVVIAGAALSGCAGGGGRSNLLNDRALEYSQGRHGGWDHGRWGHGGHHGWRR